jgi:hypothetical protein
MPDLDAKLVQDGWVNPYQLALTRQEADKSGKSLWAILIKSGFMSLEDVTVFLAQESGVAYVDTADYSLNPAAVRLLDEAFCRQNLVIPLFKIKEALFIACANPLDTELMDAIAKVAGCEVTPLIASSGSILKALNSFYGIEDKVFELDRFITKQGPLGGLAFWRESERLPLNIPVSIKIDDDSFSLPHAGALDGHTRDISRNGAAIGLEVFIFLPKGVSISLEFRPDKSLTASGEGIRVKGETVYCRMEKGQRYFLGVRFTDISDEARDRLFRLAKSK